MLLLKASIQIKRKSHQQDFVTFLAPFNTQVVPNLGVATTQRDQVFPP